MDLVCTQTVLNLKRLGCPVAGRLSCSKTAVSQRVSQPWRNSTGPNFTEWCMHGGLQSAAVEGSGEQHECGPLEEGGEVAVVVVVEGGWD